MNTPNVTLVPSPEILPPLAAVRPSEMTVATAGLVHDLGNLVQIASSAINVVARTPGMPFDHTKAVLHRAQMALDHAGGIIRQSIGQARDPSGTFRTHSDVAACLNDVVRLVEALNEPGLVLDLQLSPKLPILACDPVNLRRAVLNLVFNARDAMGGTGRVLISAQQLGSAVELSVADHGIGMSQATLARVFEPFFTTKSDGLGGIGLPLVQRFVRAAGGELAIASEVDVGTVVTLRLPSLGLADQSPEERE